MAEKKINITIDRNGNVSYEVGGVTGSNCRTEDFSFLDDLLGTVEATKNNDDFFKDEEVEEIQYGG